MERKFFCHSQRNGGFVNSYTVGQLSRFQTIITFSDSMILGRAGRSPTFKDPGTPLFWTREHPWIRESNRACSAKKSAPFPHAEFGDYNGMEVSYGD